MRRGLARISPGLARPLVLLLALLAPAVAEAAWCGPEVPWVLVEIEAGTEPELERRTLMELRATLSRRGIAVCTPSDARDGPPRVTVQIAPTETGVHIDAGVTPPAAELRQDIDLREIPEDTHGFMVAARIDEALRSRWEHLLPTSQPLDERAVIERRAAERGALERRDATPSREPAETSPHESPPLAPADAFGLAAGLRVRVFETEMIAISGSVGVCARLASHLELGAGLDGGGGPPQALVPGTADARRLSGYLSVAVSPMRAEEAVRVLGVVRVDAGAVWWTGAVEDPPASLSAPPSASVHLEGGLDLTIRLVRELELAVGAWAGPTILASYVTDGIRRLTGLAGFHAGGHLSVRSWP